MYVQSVIKNKATWVSKSGQIDSQKNIAQQIQHELLKRSRNGLRISGQQTTSHIGSKFRVDHCASPEEYKTNQNFAFRLPSFAKVSEPHEPTHGVARDPIHTENRPMELNIRGTFPHTHERTRSCTEKHRHRSIITHWNLLCTSI